MVDALLQSQNSSNKKVVNKAEGDDNNQHVKAVLACCSGTRKRARSPSKASESRRRIGASQHPITLSDSKDKEGEDNNQQVNVEVACRGGARKRARSPSESAEKRKRLGTAQHSLDISERENAEKHYGAIAERGGAKGEGHGGELGDGISSPGSNFSDYCPHQSGQASPQPQQQLASNADGHYGRLWAADLLEEEEAREWAATAGLSTSLKSGEMAERNGDNSSSVNRAEVKVIGSPGQTLTQIEHGGVTYVVSNPGETFKMSVRQGAHKLLQINLAQEKHYRAIAERGRARGEGHGGELGYGMSSPGSNFSDYFPHESRQAPLQPQQQLTLDADGNHGRLWAADLLEEEEARQWAATAGLSSSLTSKDIDDMMEALLRYHATPSKTFVNAATAEVDRALCGATDHENNTLSGAASHPDPAHDRFPAHTRSQQYEDEGEQFPDYSFPFQWLILAESSYGGTQKRARSPGEVVEDDAFLGEENQGKKRNRAVSSAKRAEGKENALREGEGDGIRRKRRTARNALQAGV